jgi:acyl-CoA synthetase (AMP-forming)/AMP-acid ligase II
MRPDLSQVDPLEHNLATRVSVGDLLTRSAQHFGRRVAIADVEAEVSYGTLDHAAERLGRALLDLGVGHQRPVALMMSNSWRFVATFFACAKAGLVALPVNTMLAAGDIAWILADAGCDTIVVDTDHLPLLQQVLPLAPPPAHVLVSGHDHDPSVDLPVRSWDELAGLRTAPVHSLRGSEPEPPGLGQRTRRDQAVPVEPLQVRIEDRDIVHCLYTSGTTSRPKGVLTSHLSVHLAALTNAVQVRHPYGDDASVMPIVLPLFHTTALDTLLLPVLLTGGTVVLPGGFEPERFLDVVERWRATHIVLLPAMYDAVLASPSLPRRQLASVRLCVYAMAPMAPERISEIARTFPRAKVLLGSGQTECVPATVFQWASHQATKSASWGPPVASVDARIMGPDGTLLPAGSEGELVYRGPHVMEGYWHNADANADAFRHGWFHSGDVGRLDDEGVVWFTDRLKDIVKTGGENVSSVAVERVLLSCPEVAECAVIGTPHPRWGEAVTAVVVAAEPGEDTAALEEKVIAHCRSHLAGFQVPKRVVVVDSLPRTATGKVQKAELRTRLTSTVPSDDLTEAPERG